MKIKRILSVVIVFVMLTCLIGGSSPANAYDPFYVKNENGVICTGAFDTLTFGQIIFYPADMADSGDTYPVIVWANGTMCAPVLYYKLLTQISAGGYIIVASTEMMAADGTQQRASIDFILSENENENSIFYHKINTEKIGVAGHSQGGKSAVNAAVADSRVDCVLSIAGSSDVSDVTNLTTPAFFMAGTRDLIVLSSIWVEPAYKNCSGPAVYASLNKAVHTSCCFNPSAYSGYAVDWFNAWLKDDAQAMQKFSINGTLSGDTAWKGFSCKGI